MAMPCHVMGMMRSGAAACMEMASPPPFIHPSILIHTYTYIAKRESIVNTYIHSSDGTTSTHLLGAMRAYHVCEIVALVRTQA